MRRPERKIVGPAVAQAGDIDSLNRLFSEAFTERYRQDGLTGVRVPWLNHDIWEYALLDAGDGALIWRDERHEIAAFNMVHASGVQGWMGPLAVRPDRQRGGIGQRIVAAGVARLEALGAQTIGLETMPRTIDNIGFYARMGFLPGHLTITLQRHPARGTGAALPLRLSHLDLAEQRVLLDDLSRLAETIAPGVDFGREIRLTQALRLGDLSVHHHPDGTLAGFALWHTAPLAKGRPRDEIRILKLGATDAGAAVEVVRGVERLVEVEGVETVSIRCQSGQSELFARLVAEGYLVHWTDLRLTLRGKGEPNYKGVLLSNWEI